MTNDFIEDFRSGLIDRIAFAQSQQDMFPPQDPRHWQANTERKALEKELEIVDHMMAAYKEDAFLSSPELAVVLDENTGVIEAITSNPMLVGKPVVVLRPMKPIGNEYCSVKTSSGIEEYMHGHITHLQKSEYKLESTVVTTNEPHENDNSTDGAATLPQPFIGEDSNIPLI